MGISENQFEVLRVFATSKDPMDAGVVAGRCNLSTREVRMEMDDLESLGFISDGLITQEGKYEMNPYRVENAIILAAEYNPDFVPLSYEKPECLLVIKGEVLIERQIRQLREAGIFDIYVVSGHKAETLFYLEKKFGVQVVFNPEYATRGSHSSLMAARKYLGNSYICSSRDYFVVSPFNKYEYRSFCAARFAEGETPRCCVVLDENNRIREAELGGADSWCLQGHAYFTRRVSGKFCRILKEEYDNHLSTQKRWRQLLLERVDELDIVAKPYDPEFIHDFENITQAEAFDPHFIESGESEILDTISSVLNCPRSTIRNIYPIEQGLTNESFHFETDEGEWAYRRPGLGSRKVVDYAAEVEALKVAKSIGFYTTFVYEDPESGWMISRFIPNARRLNPHNNANMQRIMTKIRKLHDQNVSVSRVFDFYEVGKRFSADLLECSTIYMPAFVRLSHLADQARAIARIDEGEKCFCHNDVSATTFLVDEEDNIHMVEWDYAGMADYASDIGTFAVSSQLSESEILKSLHYYFKREPTQREICHCFAYVGLAAWCWYVWSLLKEVEGDFLGDWLFVYHAYAKEYLAKTTWIAEKLDAD